MSQRPVILTDADVIEQLSEAHTLAITMLGEARGEEVEGRIAVGCVIRNRVHDERWPDDYKGVCLQRAQFSCWNQSDPNRAVLLACARSLIAGKPKANPFQHELTEETCWIAESIIAGKLKDRAYGANHYLTRRLWETSPPAWAREQRVGSLIGRHAFFKL